MPTCQSRDIDFRGLSGAFASVPPRRVSVGEPMFSSYRLMAIPIINQTIYKVGLGAYIQHHTFSLDLGLGSVSDRQLRTHSFC